MSKSPEESPSTLPREPLVIPAGELELHADLVMPERVRGLVIFAHGSGSSRHSPRNRYVAEVLYQYDFASLLADLLTVPEEEADIHTKQLRFDISLLADRLNSVARWAWQQARFEDLPTAYFGSSTGAAAAIIAAAGQGGRIKAIVSRGGRPDLAFDCLDKLNEPVLLLVGGKDQEVLRMNQEALAELNRESRLEVIPGASHLFEEPGTLAKVAERAAEWFTEQITGRPLEELP